MSITDDNTLDDGGLTAEEQAQFDAMREPGTNASSPAQLVDWIDQLRRRGGIGAGLAHRIELRLLLGGETAIIQRVVVGDRHVVPLQCGSWQRYCSMFGGR